MKTTQLDEMFIKANNLLDAGRDKDAFRVFLEAAEHGHAHSQHNVALLMELGQGTRTDKAGAIKWYLRSWRRNPQASTAENLASLYGELGNRRREKFWAARSSGPASKQTKRTAR